MAMARVGRRGVGPPAPAVVEVTPPSAYTLGARRPTDGELASAHYATHDRLRAAWRAVDATLWTEAEEEDEVWTLAEWFAVGFILACIVCAAVVVARW